MVAKVIKAFNFLKKGKQYHFTVPYITYWGCDNYHWIRFHKRYGIGWFGNVVNHDILFTITYDHGKITVERD